MLRKIFITASAFIVLSISVLGQEKIIREEYLKITPYVSTLEDVTKIYGEGEDVMKGKSEYLWLTYTINENLEIEISYFRDCDQIDKPEKERTWIVEEVFFSFDEKLKIKPKNIFLNKKDFIDCPYGDVGGQIIYFNKEKNIQFTYMSLVKTVSNLQIMATKKNKEKYKCKKDKATVTLDPKGFRCNSPN